MSVTLSKSEANIIAKMMIAVTGKCFDGTAFDDCEDMINEEDRDLIISEIQKECNRTIRNIQKKFNVIIDISSTESTISTMFFE